MNSKAIQEQKNFSSRLPPILLAVVFLVACLPPFSLPQAAWAENSGNGAAANEAPFLRTGAQANPSIEAVLELGAPYTLDLSDIFHDYDSPLTYYIREGDGSYRQTPEIFSYAYTGPAREAVITLSFKAGDGSLESPVYQVTLKYYADPSLAWLKYKAGAAGVTIVSCDGAATRVYIPDYIEGKPVTAIAADAFRNCRKLTEVRLPSSLKAMGYGALAGCESLTGIELPEGLTQVGGAAFYACASLRTVSIPASLGDFDPGVFSNCENIRFSVAGGNPSYTVKDGVIYTKNMATLVRAGAVDSSRLLVPDTVIGIGDGAFLNSRLRSITLGRNVKNIGNNAFQGCTQLTEAVFNTGLESIGDSAFEGAAALKTVVLPAGLAFMGQRVFKGSGLEKIDLSATRIEALPLGTFWDCARLRDITLGDTITVIEEGAFRNCTFEEITLPANLRRLLRSAFNNCVNLKTLTVPYTLNDLGSSVFANCTSLQSVYFEGNMPLRGEKGGNPSAPRGDDSFAQLPLETARNLKIYALQGARGWGESFTDYADGYAMGPTRRRKFEYQVDYYTLGENEKPRLILHPPESFAALEAGAVSEAAGVVRAGPLADAGPVVWTSSAAGVAAVDDEGRVTGVSAGVSAISAAVTYEGKVYTAQAEVNVAGESIFDWSLQNDGTVIINGFREGLSESQMTYLEIPETIAGYRVAGIKELAFQGNQFIYSVKIPETVGRIGNTAFRDCLMLREVSLEEGLEEIGSGAFAGTSIREIVVPESVTRIQDNVFQDCRELESATVKANNLTYGFYGIGRSLFQNCVSLKTVTLAEGIEGIGGFAFDGCASLESITLPSTLQGLEMHAFRGCGSLKTVELRGYLLRQSVHTIEKYNPFAGCAQDLVVLHPDDGNDWSSLLGNKVRTGTRTSAGSFRLDSFSTLPVKAGPEEAVNAGPRFETAANTAPDTAADSKAAPAEEEGAQGAVQNERTVFEIVKTSVSANPLLTFSIAAMVLVVVLLGGAGRYTRYKKNR